MASFNKKTYVITAKNVAYFFFKKYAIVFASTQLRIFRLSKYTIDPKAYLGRCGVPDEVNRVYYLALPDYIGVRQFIKIQTYF